MTKEQLDSLLGDLIELQIDRKDKLAKATYFSDEVVVQKVREIQKTQSLISKIAEDLTGREK